ncbi:hypothetical protein COV94_02355, partial [Candidatus Woesearchaeota archaeon CG11_big_fil_rev_8_21_14_0_20_57_5]
MIAANMTGLLAILAGAGAGHLAGMMTGLTPGLHINLVAQMLLLAWPLLTVSKSAALGFLVAMAIAHTFFDAIPSMLLGVPDEGSILAVMPAHKLVMKGRAREALALNLAGSMAAMLLFAVALPSLLLTLPTLAHPPLIVRTVVLIGLPLLALLGKNTWTNLALFAAAGLLGLATMQQDLLMPLLTGLFGMPTLLAAAGKLPFQRRRWPRIRPLWSAVKALPACGASLFSALLPGITTAHAAWLSSVGGRGQRSYILAAGAINTFDMTVSLLLCALTGVARNGIAIALEGLGLAGQVRLWPSVAGTMLVSAGTAALLLPKVADVAIAVLDRVPYRTVTILLALALTLLAFLTSGLLGLIALA